MRRSLFVLLILIFSFLFISSAKAGGASLYFAPGSGTYVIGGKFNVYIKVNTGGQEINAANGTISFDNNLLEVVGISKGGSIFPFWTTQPSFSNSAGTVNFGGGLPPPPYKGNAGQIATITFKAKKAGKALVRFTSGAVLANDGKGTNILASMVSASYVISPKSEAPKQSSKPKTNSTKKKESPKPEKEYNKPIIKSSTHPDSNKWYNSDVAKFSWELGENIKGISILLNQEEFSDPGPKSDGLFAEKEFKDLKNGISYLHLKFKDNLRWGTIAHYKIMVDREDPVDFEIKIEDRGVGEWPKAIFESKDKLSGLDHYSVLIDGKKRSDLTPETKELLLDNLKVGEHIIIITAFDKAGNKTIAEASFEIKAIEEPKIENYTKEIKPGERFFISGSAPANSKLKIFINKGNVPFLEDELKVNQDGKWFYSFVKKLKNDRYIVWAKAINVNNIESKESQRVSFLVSPPIFAQIGTFVINYFTVFVSLLFLIILIILMVVLLVWLAKKKLRKETVEIEDVLRKNLDDYKDLIDKDLKDFAKARTVKEKTKIKQRMKKNIDLVESKILKEVKDVENLLK